MRNDALERRYLLQLKYFGMRKTRIRAEEERVALMEQAVLNVKLVDTQPFVERVTSRLMELKASLRRMATQDLHHICAATGFETFIIGGSWVSMVVQKAIDLIFEYDTTYQPVQLKANDIDVYHGEFTIEDKNLTVDMNAIEYKAFEGLTLEVNTVRCRNLSAKNFLQNNDINVTASCLHVDFSKDELFELHIAPQFWKFLFDQNVNRKVSPISRLGVQNATATTCVRIAFKAFEMGIPFEFGAGGDPTNGTLATSQKEKIDAMQMWDGNPFVHYNIKKINNHYIMQKKVAREQCTKCKSRYINSRCTFKLCSKCCVDQTTEGGPCRVKSHRNAKERREAMGEGAEAEAEGEDGGVV